MRGLMSRCLRDFLGKFGHCTTCMRQSLAATLMIWAVFSIGTMVWPGTVVDYVVGSAAVALTAWWLMHIAVYAARAVIQARTGNRIVDSSARTPHSVDDTGRRQALRTLLQAAGAGVAASIPILLLPSVAFAFCGQCTKNADCGVGWVCRNTAPVNSGKVCNECVKA